MICRSNTWVGTIVTVSSLRRTLGRHLSTIQKTNYVNLKYLHVRLYAGPRVVAFTLLLTSGVFFFLLLMQEQTFWAHVNSVQLLAVFSTVPHLQSSSAYEVDCLQQGKRRKDMCIDVLNKQLCSPGNAMLWSLFRRGRHVMLFPFVVLLGGAVLEQPTVGPRPVNASLE